MNWRPFTLPATLPATRIFSHYPTRTLPEVKKPYPSQPANSTAECLQPKPKPRSSTIELQLQVQLHSAQETGCRKTSLFYCLARPVSAMATDCPRRLRRYCTVHWSKVVGRRSWFQLWTSLASVYIAVQLFNNLTLKCNLVTRSEILSKTRKASLLYWYANSGLACQCHFSQLPQPNTAFSAEFAQSMCSSQF